ncbi:U2 small nuclear ribonucleoprotein B'' [Dipsacomyces acuminosporus]|nr:U2 small nuclear ribonucleoprotein B'' [Dipsacomyces acuminosporus]
MRGQAFVVFSDITAATTALRQLNGRQFFGRPMQVEYALSKSDVVAQADGSFKFGEPRKHMSAEHRKRLLGITVSAPSNKRRQSASEGQDGGHSPKRRATEAGSSEGESDEDVSAAQQASNTEQNDSMQIAEAAAAAEASQVPSSTLFVTNLPDIVSAEMLSGLFQQYAGFKEVRRIPGKADIAFVDYSSAEEASTARNVLDGFKLAADRAMNVDFSQ